MSKKFEVEKNSKSDNLPYIISTIHYCQPYGTTLDKEKKKFQKIGTNQRTKA